MQIRELSQYEKSDYPFSVTARRESIAKNKAALQAIRENNMGTSFRESMTSDVVANYIPDLFLDEIIALGQRTAIARNNFPVVGQSTHSDFRQRYRYKDEGVQVTSKELTEVKSTQSERELATFEFLKLMDSNVLSLELIEDSTLDEVTAEVQLSANKFFRRENQLMAHRLAEYSQAEIADKWLNYTTGASDTGANILAVMTDAYLDITTKLTDRFDPSSLTWFISPQVYALLFDVTTFAEYRLSGLTSNVVSGKIAGNDSILNIPIQIWEPGYFNANSEWTSTPFDIYLVATQFAAGIRERWSIRTSPLDLNRILASGLMMFERMIPWVRNPFAYRRISPNENCDNIITNMSNIHILAGTDSPKVFNN